MQETRGSTWSGIVGAAAALVAIGAGIYLLTSESASADPTVFDVLMHGIGAYFVARGLWMIPSLSLQRSRTDASELTLERLEARRGSMSAKFYEQKKSELLDSLTHRECPHCMEEMRRDAGVCPHCQRESAPWTQKDGYWWWADDDGTWFYLDEISGEWHKPEPAAE